MAAVQPKTAGIARLHAQEDVGMIRLDDNRRAANDGQFRGQVHSRKKRRKAVNGFATMSELNRRSPKVPLLARAASLPSNCYKRAH